MKQIQVALYNGAHEASYFYYKRENYPVSPGSWRQFDNSPGGDYLANHSVYFDLGEHTMHEGSDTILHEVNGFALFVPGHDTPFYYDSLKFPIRVNRHVTVQLDMPVCLKKYRKLDNHMSNGAVRLALRHAMMGFDEPYNYVAVMSAMRDATAKEIAAAKQASA